MLGAARIEKGFDALPEIIAALPRKCDGHTIKLRVQTSSDAADPRVQARSNGLQDYVAGNGLDRLPIEILAGPATREIYFSWFAQSDILLAPYISSKYVASTSGVFVEALHFLTPIITVQNTWMAQQIESARAQGLHIGEVVGQLNEIGAKTEIIAGNLTRYRQDMRTYLAYWKSFHSPQTIITMLLKP
jgi:glycosyltransferase involved in cell wall biosynthesis